jgi:hypothetical protein
MDRLCQLCLSKIGPEGLPVCQGCYADLHKLPIGIRMSRCLEIARNIEIRRLAGSMERLSDELVALVEQSKRWSPHRIN